MILSKNPVVRDDYKTKFHVIDKPLRQMVRELIGDGDIDEFLDLIRAVKEIGLTEYRDMAFIGRESGVRIYL